MTDKSLAILSIQLNMVLYYIMKYFAIYYHCTCGDELVGLQHLIHLQPGDGAHLRVDLLPSAKRHICEDE